MTDEPRAMCESHGHTWGWDKKTCIFCGAEKQALYIKHECSTDCPLCSTQSAKPPEPERCAASRVETASGRSGEVVPDGLARTSQPPEPEEVLKRHYPLSYADPRIDNEEPIKIGALNMLAALEWAFNGYGELNVLPDDVKRYRAELRKKVEG